MPIRHEHGVRFNHMPGEIDNATDHLATLLSRYRIAKRRRRRLHCLSLILAGMLPFFGAAFSAWLSVHNVGRIHPLDVFSVALAFCGINMIGWGVLGLLCPDRFGNAVLQRYQ